MVAGMHKYLDRELAARAEKRDAAVEDRPLHVEGRTLREIAASRTASGFAKMLGVVDERVQPKLEYVGGPGEPALVAEIDGYKVSRGALGGAAGRRRRRAAARAEGQADRRTSSRSRTPTRRRSRLAGLAEGATMRSPLRLAEQRLPRARSRRSSTARTTSPATRSSTGRRTCRTASSSTAWPTRWAARSSATRCRRCSRRWTGSRRKDAKLPVGVIGYGDGGRDRPLRRRRSTRGSRACHVAGLLRPREKTRTRSRSTATSGACSASSATRSSASLVASAAARPSIDSSTRPRSGTGQSPAKPGRAAARHPGTTRADPGEAVRRRSRPVSKLVGPKLQRKPIVDRRTASASRRCLVTTCSVEAESTTSRDR